MREEDSTASYGRFGVIEPSTLDTVGEMCALHVSATRTRRTAIVFFMFKRIDTFNGTVMLLWGDGCANVHWH